MEDDMIRNRKEKTVQQLLSYSTVVIGGGIAGVTAAAAAAKTGSRTLLVESSTFLGGVVTMGPLEALMTQYDQSRKVIAGLGEELIASLGEMDPQAQNVPDTTGYCSRIVPYRAEDLKLQILRMLQRYGVDYLTETVLTEVQTSGNCVDQVCLQTKTGMIRVKADSFVDCSGSGFLGYLAGCDVMTGDDAGICQPVTVLSRWGGVDPKALREYVQEHPEDFHSFGEKPDLSAEMLHLWGFSSALAEGSRCGRLSLHRNEMHLMETTVPGEVVVNFSRISADPLDQLAMSRAQTEGSLQILELLRYFRETIPAFRNARIVQGGYVGVRESGRVKGRAVLTREDIVSGGDPGTSVAMGAFPIDIHQPGSGMRYERILKGYCIPGGALIAEGFSNLFLGGRCISSTFEANASCRISVTCMATGHAAGVLAAVRAMEADVRRTEETDWLIRTAQKILADQGAVLS